MAAYHRVYDSITCRLTAKNLDRLRNLTLGNRVWATFPFYGVTVDAGRRRRLSELIGEFAPVYYDRATILQRTTRSTEDSPSAPAAPLRFTMHAYGRCARATLQLRCYNNNNNIYGAIVTTKVIARFHPVQ